MKAKFKIFLVLLTSFLVVNVISLRKNELTPREFVYKTLFILPKNLSRFFLEKTTTISKPVVKITLSKEKLKKEKFYYNGEEFEVLIDPSIELSQKKIKFLYKFYKSVNRNNK